MPLTQVLEDYRKSFRQLVHRRILHTYRKINAFTVCVSLSLFALKYNQLHLVMAIIPQQLPNHNTFFKNAIMLLNRSLKLKCPWCGDGFCNEYRSEIHIGNYEYII